MKVQADLMATMDELVNDSFQGASKRDLLVEYECSRGKFSREQEPMEVLDRIIKTMQHKMFRVKALLEQVLQPWCSLGVVAMMKMKVDVVEEMDHLVNDSL
jgi:hypothetical protein